MIKYYTRACNFYYGNQAKNLVEKKAALSLCGSKKIAFDKIELFKRNKNKINSRIIHLKDLKRLNQKEFISVKKSLKKITAKRKNFINNINFSAPNVMGIINLTPDSFSDGGKFNKKNVSLKRVSSLINSGASIIDVGGESTRPGSKTVDSKVEWKRIEHVIKNFKKRYGKTCLSLDTRKSELMVQGIKFGVDIINDVSGFNHDKDSLNKLKIFKIPKILHHMQGTPQTMQNNPKYRNALLDIYDYFEYNIKYKFKDKKILLDPGIGFGKNLKHNLTLISKISLFHSLGFPIMIGTSRKRFINEISGLYDSKDRTGGTIASVLYLLSQGVQIFRVHNVKEVKQSILVFEKILFN